MLPGEGIERGEGSSIRRMDWGAGRGPGDARHSAREFVDVCATRSRFLILYRGDPVRLALVFRGIAGHRPGTGPVPKHQAFASRAITGTVGQHCSAVSRPMMLSKLDFPQPLAPTRKKNSASAIQFPYPRQHGSGSTAVPSRLACGETGASSSVTDRFLYGTSEVSISLISVLPLRKPASFPSCTAFLISSAGTAVVN